MLSGLLNKMRGLLGGGAASAGLKSPDFNPAAMQGADPHSLFQLPKAGNISMPDAAGAKPPVGGMFARPSMEAMQYFNPPAGRASSSMNPGDIQPMQVPPRPLPDTPRLPIAPRIAMPGANQNAERALNMMEANAISADGVAPVAPSFDPSTIGADSLRIPEMRTDSVRDVPVPQLPGHKGEPVPYNPVDYAKYRYVMDKMGRDEQGNETGIKRDWKDMLKTGLLGAAQGIQQAGGNPWGALGGFGAGFAGAAISPQAGREFIFDTAIKPGVMEQEQRGIQQQDRQRQTRMDDLRRRQIEAGIQRTEADTKDVDLEREKLRAQIAKTNAEAEARKTGRPQLVDEYDPQTGAILKVAVYPDGRKVEVGQSGAGQLRREGFETREGIADKQIGSREKIATDSAAAAMERARLREQGLSERQSAKMESVATPTEAVKAMQDVQAKKRAANAAWNKAKAEKDPATRAEMEDNARLLLEDYNQAATDLGELYPDQFDIQEGTGGWRHIARKGGQRSSGAGGGTATPATTVSRAAVEGYAQEKGIPYDEALKRFSDKGIQVRQ